MLKKIILISLFFSSIASTQVLPRRGRMEMLWLDSMRFGTGVSYQVGNHIFWKTPIGTFMLDTSYTGVYEPVITAANTTKKYWNGFKQFVSLSYDSIAAGTIDTAYTNAVSNVIANAPISVSTSGKTKVI